MKTVAIIPAGGVGKRMGTEIPKQYLLLAGIPILVHTLQAFQRSPVIDEIFLVVPEADIPEVRQVDRCEIRPFQGRSYPFRGKREAGFGA